MLGILITQTQILSADIENQDNPILVPDDYPTIQQAIDGAQSGDTILVRNGTYQENIIIDKSLSLSGESNKETIIVGSLDLHHDSISIQNFHFNIKDSNDTGDVRINVDDVDSCVIRNNNLTNCNIYLLYANHTIIDENIFVHGGYAIWLRSSSLNKIQNNTLIDCTTGIYIQNDFLNTGWMNTIQQNTMIHCGMRLFGQRYNNFIQHIDRSNTVDGKPVYYHLQESDVVVPSDAGEIILVSCNDCIINDSSPRSITLAYSNYHIISHSDTSISLFQSKANQLINNTLSECNLYRSDDTIIQQNICNQISIEECDECQIRSNIIQGRNGNGIYLYHSSENLLTFNMVSNQYGLTLSSDSVNNTVFANCFHDCTMGLRFHDSTPEKEDGNLLYQNAFIHNEIHAIDDGENHWFNKSLGVGNFWDDYSGEDVDDNGIGDSAYVIEGELNLDSYPLMSPAYNVPPSKPVVIGKNRGKPGTEITFQVRSLDLNDDKLFYDVDWGDASILERKGPFQPGKIISLSHTWKEQGSYDISIQAIDEQGTRSVHAINTISMQKQKDVFHSLRLLLQEFPLFYHIIQLVYHFA